MGSISRHRSSIPPRRIPILVRLPPSNPFQTHPLTQPSCYNTRRRRRQGMAPMYGTGWMAGKPPAGQQSGYYNSNQPYNGGQAYNHPAPPYSPPIGNQATGNTFNSNDGYYGHHNNGYAGNYTGPQYELQPPQNVYAPARGVGGENVYEAPQGPPPGKGDGVIR